jgi:excisionase family DNA binding protein
MPNISEQIPHSRQQTIAAPQPLAVSPKDAGRLLGLGKTTIFRLLKCGELTSYTDGSRRSRRILLSSINAWVERKVAETNSEAAGRTRKNKT